MRRLRDQRARDSHWRRWRKNRQVVFLLPIMLMLVGTLASCGSPAVFTEPALNAHSAGSGRSLASTLPAPPPAFHTYNGTLLSPPAVSAREAFLIDPTTGTIYLASDADQEVEMASTTKIMTAYVALTVGKLDQLITVGADANAATLQQEYGASVADLQTGDVLSLQDLLYALLLPSGDDAAVAIADGIAGSQQNFVALMNVEAALLGLRHTHYSDVHGLDSSGLYTTARDLARLAGIAMRNPTFAEIVQTPSYTLPATANHGAFSWSNTNELLTPTGNYYFPGTIGIKTGYTGGAGGCLVFEARRPYGELLGVLLGEAVENTRFTDAAALLNWGFDIEEQQAATAKPSATATAVP